MTSSRYDVVAVGNAIVDILKSVPDAFLAEENIPKASMTLIDEARADHLTTRFTDAVTTAGGSAANTVTGVASFGGKSGGRCARRAFRNGIPRRGRRI
jgi:sugar/nucleoside kinase (ribokinase family)